MRNELVTWGRPGGYKIEVKRLKMLLGVALANVAAANIEVGLWAYGWGPAWNWLHLVAVLNLLGVAMCYREWQQLEE